MNINEQYIYELIENLVKVINDKKFEIKYKSNNYILSLKDWETENIDFYINNYELRPCKKKNHFPNYDLPNYYAKSLLNNIEKEVICFIPKDPINILLIEKYDTIEQEKKYFEYNNFNDDIVQNEKILDINESKKRKKLTKSNKNIYENNCIII